LPVGWTENARNRFLQNKERVGIFRPDALNLYENRFSLMFIEKLMGKGKSCAPLGREMAGTGDFLRPYRRLVS
jgi:hypothetical protein